MISNKLILGFVGLLCSGKGTAAEYCKTKFGADTHRFSTILRDLTRRLYLEETRDNLIRISECVRAEFGEEVLSKAIANDAAKQENKIVVIEGIRRTQDIKFLSQLSGFVLVEIFAAPETRYSRLVARRENTDDATKTYEQFLKDHERSTEISIPEVAKQAVEKIDNNGDFSDLCRQLDALVRNHTH